MYHIDSSYTLESFHIGVDLQHTEWKVCEWWRRLFFLNVHLLKSAANYELWHNPCTMSLQAFIWYPYWLSIVLLYSHFRLHDNAVCIANNKIQNFLLAQSDKMCFIKVPIFAVNFQSKIWTKGTFYFSCVCCQ